MRNPEYLGDAVYAEWDGHYVKLMTEDHERPANVIYLEPCTLQALNDFYEEMSRRKI